jgi:hypothetical protein
MDTKAQPGLLQSEEHGRVVVISGGIGKQEQEFLRQVRPDYNLHLLFAARGSGAYLGGATVKISTSGGINVLDAYANGPRMFIRLAPGSYRVSAEYGGYNITRRISVSSVPGADVVFDFPAAVAH